MNAQNRILVVNANLDEQQATVHTLTDAGYLVLVASTGTEALERCPVLMPDLVLLNPALPDMDGLALCRQLKTACAQNDVLIVFCADASLGPDYRARALEDGADGFFIKPLSDRECLARVTAFLRVKTAARSVKDSEAQLRHVIMNNADGMIVVNQEGVIQFANAAAESLFNVAANGLRDEVFGFPIAAADTTTEIDIINAQGRPTTVEMRVVDLIWNQQPAYLASLRDISDRKLAEQQRVTLAIEQQKVRFLSSFVSNISHEISTPLMSIVFTLQRLKRALTLPDRLSSAVEQAQHEVYYINELIASMLILARLESNPTLDLTRQQVNTLILGAADSMQEQAAAKSITLETDLDDELLAIQSDYTLLSNALTRVLENAIEFTPEGGHIQVRASKEQHHAVITIRDNGIGIHKEDLPHIFTHFYRADKARTDRRSGLGLTIAKKIIETHNGRITIQSQPGHGTAVTIYLPLTLTPMPNDKRPATTA